MNIFKSPILVTLIISTVALVANAEKSSMTYVVFNGENCNIAGDYGRACQEYSNSGVLEVTRESTGVYIIYFLEPYSDNNYVVLTSSNLQNTGGAFSSISGNDDSLNGYYGVSRYFVRIETRQLSANINANSDYITVVANPEFGTSSVVFDGEDCPAASCTTMSKIGVEKVDREETGLYRVTFDSPKAHSKYVVLASSNVWGTGGTITSIGGNTIDGQQYEITKASIHVDSRLMTTNARSASDYVSVVAGIPIEGYRYVVFHGGDCTGSGEYGTSCTIYSQSGVDEVQRESGGQYKIWWKNDMPNANYVVLCDSNVWGSTGTVCGFGGNNQGSSSAHGISVKFVEIQTRKMANNGVSDCDYISVLAFD